MKRLSTEGWTNCVKVVASSNVMESVAARQTVQASWAAVFGETLELI